MARFPSICSLPSGAAFAFAVFTVALITSKGIRLVTHAFAIPTLAFVFYLPTFFFFDVLAICFCRLLLWQPINASGRFLYLFLIPRALGWFLSALALGAAASQLSFFLETGGELEWREAGSYVTSSDGLRVLLTGSARMLLSAAVMIVVSLFLSNILYGASGSFLAAVGENLWLVGRFLYLTFKKHAAPRLYLIYNERVAPIVVELRHRYQRTETIIPAKDKLGKYAGLEDWSDDDGDDMTVFSDRQSESGPSDWEGQGLLLNEAGKGDTSPLGSLSSGPLTGNFRLRRLLPALPWIVEAVLLILVTLFFIIAFAVRPCKPYNHMSVTLPIALLDVFHSGPGFCAEQRRLMNNKWPLPELLDTAFWEKPQGHYKGWAPDSANGTRSSLAEEYRTRTAPKWLPATVPLGFFRWDPLRIKNGFLGSHGSSKPVDKRKCPGLKLPDPFYNPVSDPMKITNLDNDILEPVREALGDGSVKIRHVFFILMESLRQDLFPIRYDSDIVRDILEANPSLFDKNRVNDHLAHLTRHIEMITGVSGDFKKSNMSMIATNMSMPTTELKWHDQAREGYGGINVVGAYTGSTMSTKSFATNHCGAWVMPVEKFEESETFSYQPCLPQILELFNSYKPKVNTSSNDDYLNHEWYPALFESMTEQYDRQDRFDKKIGFKHTVTRKELKEDSRYNETDPMYEEVNYFSFAEPVLRPYLREYIGNATANNQRMFMTHFTSTTHHSWNTPHWFTDRADYLPTSGSDNWHTNFNKYLNTVRFHDAWMAELMQLLDDTGIANETLVILAGDHGQAFEEDYYKKGTYENGHVSNFRVPITFRHPNLPRVQYAANASSVSILPTVLDLLLSSGSLGERDAAVAADILPEYEGQSLIRPYRATRNGRRAWNFTVINSGAGMLSVTSADSPYRLVMPLGKVFEYRLTDLSTDPQEKEPIEKWGLDELIDVVGTKFGDDAAKWATEAEAVGKWWSLERQRLWRYHSSDGKDFQY